VSAPDFFAELEGHLIEAAERERRVWRLPAVRPRRLLAAAAVVAALAAALAFALPATESERPVVAPVPTPVPPTACPGDYGRPTSALRDEFGVLSRAPTPADRLPKGLHGATIIPSGIENPAYVRLALTDSVGRRFYVLPTALPPFTLDICAEPARTACVRAVGPDDRLVGQSCNTADALSRVPRFEVVPSEPPLVFGLAPDGVSRVVISARSGTGAYYPVESNVWSGRMTFEPAEARFVPR
jgi:hypothetical protein